MATTMSRYSSQSHPNDCKYHTMHFLYHNAHLSHKPLSPAWTQRPLLVTAMVCPYTHPKTCPSSLSLTTVKRKCVLEQMVISGPPIASNGPKCTVRSTDLLFASIAASIIQLLTPGHGHGIVPPQRTSNLSRTPPSLLGDSRWKKQLVLPPCVNWRLAITRHGGRLMATSRTLAAECSSHLNITLYSFSTTL